MIRLPAWTRLTAALPALLVTGAAWAQEAAPETAPAVGVGREALGQPVVGAPEPMGMGFQEAATSLARNLQWLDGMILWIITGIVIFVTALLIWVIIRYNERRNPTPAGFTHNSPLEIAWTVVPIIILVFIGAFSLPVLFQQQTMPEPDVRITVSGHQWYWNYNYVDEGFEFPSYMIGQGQPQMTDAEDDPVAAELVAAGYTRDDYLLAVDEPVLVPVGADVVMTVTGGDVLHSWTIPAFGVKQDAVPGRFAQLWFNAEKEGVYYGQCSELCGSLHAYMPIVVRVVSQAEYDAWVAERRPAAS